jgi:hypothetical protein
MCEILTTRIAEREIIIMRLQTSMIQRGALNTQETKRPH